MGQAHVDVEAAAGILGRGGIVVLPTETVFGLGASLHHPEAVRRLAAIKGRDEGKPFQVLLADVDDLEVVARPDDRADRVARAFFPGPLTLVLVAREELPDLGGRPGTVGVRVPDHPVASALLRTTGPIVASSANRSGDATPASLAGVRRVFGDEVDGYLDGVVGGGAPSSVLDLTGPEPVLLREGAIPREALEETVGPVRWRGW